MLNRIIVVLAVCACAFACDKKPSGSDTASTPATGDAPAKATGDKASDDEVAKIAKGALGKIKGAEALINAGKDLKGNAAGIIEGGPGLTVAQYEVLMLGLDACTVKETGIDRKCPAHQALIEGRKKGRTSLKSFSGQMSGLGKKHIRHGSPAVRMHAASLMSGFFGSSKESQGVIIEAAKTEKDPAVFYYLIRSVGSSIAKNDDVKALVLSSTTHQNERVRIEAGSWLTSVFATTAEGTLERAMEMVEKDSSNRVRSSICSNLGRRGDDRVIPLLAKLTKDPNGPLYAACLRGLIGSWATPAPHKNPSKKGYELTLKRLGETPRSEKRPAWAAISGMRWAKNWVEKPQLAERAPWFKKERVIAVLGAIVKDRKSNWLARTSAVEVMGALKVQTSGLNALRKSYEGATGRDAHVVKKIDKVLAKLTAPTK